MMIRGKFKAKPWMGIFGLLGFLGFAGVPLHNPSYVTFFCFFGFFGYYWEGKLAKEIPDERLNANRQRAMQIAYRVGLALAFGGMIIIGNLLGYKDPAKAYVLLNAVVALAFALSLNLSAYLTYRFDKNGCEDE